MKKRFIGLAAVYMFIPAMLLAQPAGKKQLVGVWEVKEAPVEQSQSPLLSLAMFGGDGSFNTTGGYKALPSIPAVQEVATEIGLGYGRWAATGDRVVHHRAKTSYGARNRIEAINAKGVVTQAEVKVYDVGRMPDGHGG